MRALGLVLRTNILTRCAYGGIVDISTVRAKLFSTAS